MVGPRGEVLVGPTEKTSEMYRRGFRLETKQEEQQRKLQEEYGGTGSQIATAAHAIGNTATFGALDVAGSLIGGDDYTERVKKQREANPTTDLVSTIGTIGASLWTPGGPANAVKGLGRLATPIKSVAKLGKAVERGTLKMLGGAKGNVVRQALAKGTSLGLGAGVEGSVYGAGEFFSEAALGEIEPTAENFLAHTGTGALWGGAAGGALGASGPLIGKILGTGKAFAGQSARGIRKLYEKARGVKAADGLEEALEKSIIKPLKPSFADKAYGTFYDFDPKKMARLKDPGNLARARKGVELRETANKELGDMMDEMASLHDELAEQGVGQAKYRGIREVQKEANRIEAFSDSMGRLDSANAQLDGMLQAGPAEFADPAAIKYAKEAVLSADDLIKSAARSGSDDAVAQAFIKLDQTKRTIQKRIARLWRKADKADANWNTIKELEYIETGIRESLENAKLWGNGAATRQIASNRGWVRKLKKKHMSSKFSELYETEKYAPVFRTNRKMLKSTIDRAGLEGNKFEQEFLDNFVDDQLAPARAIAESFELGPKYIKKLNRMNELGQKFQKRWGTIKETVSLENQLGEIMQKSSAMGSLAPGLGAAGVGYMVGGEEGAAIGLMLSPFTNPGRYLQVKAALTRISGDINVNIGKAIKGYISKITGKTKATKAVGKRMIGPTSQRVLQDSNWGDKRTKDKNRYDAFDKRVSELRDFVSNPTLAAERLKKNTDAVADVAPNLAGAIQQKAVNAANFLYDKAPKQIRGTSLLANKYKPSEVELVRFERYVEAVLDPLVMLRDLRRGVLTRETVEAVQTCYPEMYQKVVVMLAQQIPNLRQRLPYKDRINLSVLFEIPVDETMEPDFVATMKMINAAPPPEPMQTNRGAAGKEWGKLKAGQVALTDTQRIQSESA